jgi:sulfate/thiosulfate transport system substrate-binding protein
MMPSLPRFLVASWLWSVPFVLACGGPEAAPPSAAESLTLGAYTTPREAYGEILPLFAAASQAKGQPVTFKESYLGSGAQTRAIVAGFEADVAALSLEADVDALSKAGLITHDWKQAAVGGMVTRSIVVIGVRKGNPKQIKDWDDLAKPGVAVLTPNVRTSGGARWNIAAIWGAALRGHTSAPAGDTASATKLLGAILRNVKNMDAGARESLLNFERGVGDAIITYENEILVGQHGGKDYEYIVPKSTILIENPAAVVDKYADAHGTRKLADALVAYLVTPEAQRTYVKHGLRPVNPEIDAELGGKFPKPTDLFTVRDVGDWAGLDTAVFKTGAAYDQAMGTGAP